MLREPRSDVVLIGLEVVDDRAFGRWSMAFINDSAATTSIIHKHCGVDRLTLDYITMPEAVALGWDLLNKP